MTCLVPNSSSIYRGNDEKVLDPCLQIDVDKDQYYCTCMLSLAWQPLKRRNMTRTPSTAELVLMTFTCVYMDVNVSG